MATPAIRKRKLSVVERPAFTREDAWFLAELPILAAVATVVPERKWGSVCTRLERIKSSLGRFSPERIRRGMSVLDSAKATVGNALGVAATRSEHHVQIIRDYLWGWSAPMELVGRDNLERSLDEGRGALLWVAHFSFNSLAAKRALHNAGFQVSHMSRDEHGFSKSRFGIAWLNPIRVKTERRYLAGRIAIDRANPLSAVRRAYDLLAANQIVSITAGAWEGARVVTVGVGGAELDLATGAPGLALTTGAALLPVFTVRDPGGTGIRVVVDGPIAKPVGGDHDDAMVAMAQEYARRLMPFVSAYPLQWRDWEKLRPARSR